MRNAAFLIAFASLLVAGWGTVPDAVTDEAGGLPALTAQVQALQTLVASLQATVATLQSANTTLLNALKAEIAARVAGDTALQTALTQESTQRSAAETALRTAVTQETANRISGDQHLQDLITPLQTSGPPEVFTGTGGISDLLNNAAPTVVAFVDVPAGQYLIQAVVPVFNMDADEQVGECALYKASSPGGVLTRISDTRPFQSASSAQMDLQDIADDIFEAQLPLLATASLPQPATIVVACTGFKWRVIFSTVSVLSVHAIH